MKYSKKLLLIPAAVLVLVGGYVGLKPIIEKRTALGNNGSSANAGGNDCGADRECFYKAYTDSCNSKTITTTQTTVEGDPIETTAKTVTGDSGCVVEVTMDASKDRFGDGKVHTYTCKKLVQEPQVAPLLAKECTGSNMLTEVSI